MVSMCTQTKVDFQLLQNAHMQGRHFLGEMKQIEWVGSL